LDGAGTISGGGTNPYRYRHVGMTAQAYDSRRGTQREEGEPERERRRGRGDYLFITTEFS